MRKFLEVKEEAKKIPSEPTIMPVRSDGRSAGYDFFSKERCVLSPGETHMFWTDIKAVMYFDNVLMIYPRSGLGFKKGIVIKNLTGVIDASYANNPNNDGNIGIGLVNMGEEEVVIEKGDRIAQGVFMKYYIVDDDKFLLGAKDEGRKGGLGSSGE